VAIDASGFGAVKPAPELSIIIAMLNPAPHLDNLLPQLVALDETFDHEVILVDDGSTDGSLARLEAAVAAHPRWSLIRLSRNGGLGRARDAGYMQALGRYLYFFDADDRLNPEGLRALLDRAVETEADIALAPYSNAPDFLAEDGPMSPMDQRIWEGLRGRAPTGRFTLAQYPEILALTPFAWVRVVRLAFAVETGYRHSTNRLIDDMLPHWTGLFAARRLAWSGVPVCTHIISRNPERLSNTADERRFGAFDAADELAEAVGRLGRRVPGQSVLLWRARLAAILFGLAQIGPELKPAYRRRLRQSLAQIDRRDAQALIKVLPQWQLRSFQRYAPPRPTPMERAWSRARRLASRAKRALRRILPI